MIICYADDIQLYLLVKLGESNQFMILQECLQYIKTQKTSTFLLLNSEIQNKVANFRPESLSSKLLNLGGVTWTPAIVLEVGVI